MSFIRIVTHNGKRLVECECDQCGKIFTKRYRKRYTDITKLTFCSRECSKISNRPGGKGHEKFKQTSLKKYGVENPFQSKEVKEKIKKKNIENYGVEHILQSDKIKEKFKKTCLKKYGAENPFQSEKIKKKIEKTNIRKYGTKNPQQTEEFKEKTRQTCLKRYGVETPFQSVEVREKFKRNYLKKNGVENPFQDEKIKEKIKVTCLKRYGIDNPLKTKDVHKKIKETCLRKYGVDNSRKSKNVREKIKCTCREKYGSECPTGTDEIRERIRQTCIKKYGVDNPLKSKEIRSKIDWTKASQKSHETMKKNGTYRKSKSEDQFYEYLCKIFDENNIKRQVMVNNWSIDFYIKSIDTYIQFDGVYWHGLDKDIEIIKEFKNPRDRVIYETYLRDKEQNKYFKKSGLKLIRVTDKEFQSGKMILSLDDIDKIKYACD